MKSQKVLQLISVGFLFILIISGLYYFLQNYFYNNETEQKDSTINTQNTLANVDSNKTDNNNTVNQNSMQKYNDGTYSGSASFFVPKNKVEKITVTLTLEKDVIKDVSYQATESSGDSKYYNSLFGNNYKSQVVGKKIDEVNLINVAGASLTPIGFNDALDKIKQQAKK